MTSKKIDKLDSENLEPRVAPVLVDHSGGADLGKAKGHNKPVDPGEPPAPSDPAPDPREPIYDEPIL